MSGCLTSVMFVVLCVDLFLLLLLYVIFLLRSVGLCCCSIVSF